MTTRQTTTKDKTEDDDYEPLTDDLDSDDLYEWDDEPVRGGKAGGRTVEKAVKTDKERGRAKRK